MSRAHVHVIDCVISAFTVAISLAVYRRTSRIADRRNRSTLLWEGVDTNLHRERSIRCSTGSRRHLTVAARTALMNCTEKAKSFYQIHAINRVLVVGGGGRSKQPAPIKASGCM